MCGIHLHDRCSELPFMFACLCFLCTGDFFKSDPTVKFMNLVIAHCVIVQVACLLCRIYILVLFGSSRAYYNCLLRTWIFLGIMNSTRVSYFALLSGCILFSPFRIGHLKYMCNHIMIQ
jgi:hypothetical protein